MTQKQLRDLNTIVETYGSDKQEDIPYFAEPDLANDTFIKYPVGSEWILKCDGFEIPVWIKKMSMIDNWILAVSISDDPKYKYFKVCREPEWFDGKLFPKER